MKKIIAVRFDDGSEQKVDDRDLYDYCRQQRELQAIRKAWPNDDP